MRAVLDRINAQRFLNLFLHVEIRVMNESAFSSRVPVGWTGIPSYTSRSNRPDRLDAGTTEQIAATEGRLVHCAGLLVLCAGAQSVIRVRRRLPDRPMH